MSASITFRGLTELFQELDKLPEALRYDAAAIALSEANAAADEARAEYPTWHTGNLAGGVRVEVQAGGLLGVKIQVRNRAAHAHLYELGTRARAYMGWDRGVMPATAAFVPPMQRHRRRMYDEIAEMMGKHGLRVSGDANA